MDTGALCWACRGSIYREPHEWLWGEVLCMGCVKQLKELLYAIRKNAVNDRSASR